MVLTPPARIKKKSEISSPIELIRSVRALCEASHLRGLALPVEDGPNDFSPSWTKRLWSIMPVCPLGWDYGMGSQSKDSSERTSRKRTP